jgi:ring-1,2-phenylacetyl-CoA epoxidase subunit PaaE
MNPYHKVEVTEIRQETIDTKSFVLRPLGSHPITYKPGQFLTLVFPGHPDEQRRSYSISSSDFLNEPLTITVKRIDNGAFSRYLFDECRVGSILLTIGASGLFTLPDSIEMTDSIIFFAAGSGITPIIALIKSALLQHTKPAIQLIYSNHNPESTIFYSELKELEKSFSGRFRVTYFFSNAQNLLMARLNKSLVAGILNQVRSTYGPHTLCYLCGPHTYMQMITITLLTEGVPAANIRREIFDTVKPVTRDRPPDEDEHQVTIRYRSESFRFHVRYPDTILAAARNNKIFLPYSCEAGKCGTCAATCLEGKVWMSYNEVLSDRELVRDRILTCTGHPVYGDVVLEVE